jgi:DNA-binding transcriptional regulator YiaG
MKNIFLMNSKPKKIREELGLTQLQMSELMGIHRQTWIKWERGERKPGRAALRLMAVLLWLCKEKLISHLIKHLSKKQ